METNLRIAFKEWAVIVDALARGQQVLVLRKGGIHEQRGEFRVTHHSFWLFPTQFHESEDSVIASSRPAVRAAAARLRSDAVPIQFYAVVEAVHELADLAAVRRLTGQHIWSDGVLEQRFAFGRAPGLHALVVRVYRRPEPCWLPLLLAYGGCRSWIELEQTVDTAGATPVLAEAEFRARAALIAEQVGQDAVTHA